MPLGNLTSQFFANVYLNKLDQFVKHKLKIKNYIRYVDDFVILGNNKHKLENLKERINLFLKENLRIELHPDKSKVISLNSGINFLGFRIFYHHKLLRKKNMRKFEKKFLQLKEFYKNDIVERDKVLEIFEGWLAYSVHADTYKYQRHITRLFNNYFPINKTLEIKNIKKEEKIAKNIEQSEYDFSTQKTMQLLKKRYTIEQIAQERDIKESTVYDHLAKLIEHGQLSVWKVIKGKKVAIILKNIYSPEDKLKDIRMRVNDPGINFNEINCVLASVKKKNQRMSINHHVQGYKKTNCHRKCYFEPAQRALCTKLFERLISLNTEMKMTKKEFLEFFNNNVKICILPEKEKLSFVPWNKFKTHIKKI